MTRPLRIQYPNAVYHVMNRGAGRRSIFLDQADNEGFLSILEQAWERWGIEVYAYCLMSNHYHLCLRTPEAKLARVMRHINGVYTQSFNRRHHRDGTLFRGRYKALVIEEDAYLGEVVRYIHLNPVKARLVKEPQRYRWSSHRAYLERGRCPRWLKTQPMRSQFGSAANFHQFVMEGNEEALESWYEQKRMPPILGTEAFIEEIRALSKKPTKEHVRTDKVYVRPPLEKVLRVVAKGYGLKITDLLTGRRGQENEARKVAIWMVRELCDHPYEKIAGNFGVGIKTVSWACSQVSIALSQNGPLFRRIRTMRKMLDRE